MRIFKKSVYFLFESGSLDSPGGPSSNRRYSITGVLRRRVIMNFTSKGPAEAKSTITLRRIHLIRRPYAKRRGRRETMFDCPLSKTVKILDQRSCSTQRKEKIQRKWEPAISASPSPPHIPTGRSLIHYGEVYYIQLTNTVHIGHQGSPGSMPN